MLKSSIPVMAANWMKLSLRFAAFAKSPKGFPKPGGAEDDMSPNYVRESSETEM